MANPEGTRANRWNQVVAAVESETGWSTVQADTWLNEVWVSMLVDESAGDPETGLKLNKWLAANSGPTTPTMPSAFIKFVT